MRKRINRYLSKTFHLFREAEPTFLLIFSVGVGIASGLGAIFFRWLITFFEHFFFEGGKDLFSFVGSLYVILVPAVGGLIVGPLTYFFAKETKGHGIPEVMVAVRIMGGRIRARVAAVKILSSSICIGSGGSVGQEGPIAQIGSAFGSYIGQLFRFSEEKTKILVACGAAGGIAASFNAPLGGTFFALEVILGEYGPRYLSSVVLSAVSATVISRYFLGDIPAFEIPAYGLTSAWELPLYLLLGIITSFFAILYIKIIYRTEDKFDLTDFPEYLKPAMGGLIVGLAGYFYPQVFGVGYESIEMALYGNHILFTGIVLIFLKIFTTAVTVGSGGSGGIFAPALFIGAMVGEVFGILANSYFTEMTIFPGSYALVGMGAFFAGASGAPITTIFILFEMTGDYKIILPLMITCIVSTYMVRLILKGSIYSLKLKRRGIDIDRSTGIDLMETLKVSDAMIKDVIVVNETSTVRKAGLKIKSTRHRGFPVVDDAGVLAGIISHRDINHALDSEMAEVAVKEVMTTDLITCYSDETLRAAIEKLGKKDIGRMPVVDSDDPTRLIGLISRKSILKSFNKELMARGESTRSEG